MAFISANFDASDASCCTQNFRSRLQPVFCSHFQNGEPPFASPISRSISHLEFFWVSGLLHLPFQMHKRYIRRIRTRDPMISKRTLSPLDYRTEAAEATENLWYLCTVAGPDLACEQGKGKGRGEKGEKEREGKGSL